MEGNYHEIISEIESFHRFKESETEYVYFVTNEDSDTETEKANEEEEFIIV